MGFWLGTFRFLLACLVSIIFIFAGTCKITPAVHPNTFYELDQKFRGPYVKVIQGFVTNTLKTKHRVNPSVLKRYLGIAELISVLLIWSGNGQIGGSILACIMAGACYVHVSLKEDYFFPMAVGLMCLCISWMSIKKGGYARPPKVGKPLRPDSPALKKSK